MKRWLYRSSFDGNVVESFSGRPSSTFWSKWFGGVIAPFFLVIIGISCCATQSATFYGRGAGLLLHGKDAITMGIAWLSVAAFLHFHYLWGNIECLMPFFELGKIIATTIFILSFGYVCWSVMANQTLL